MIITVFGASGKVGGAAAVELRRRGFAVRAVLRDLSKGTGLVDLGCSLVQARLEDSGAVGVALKGSDAVLLLCPVPLTTPDPLADARRFTGSMVDAIERARPPLLAAISDYGAHDPAAPGITAIFRQLEERLGALPVRTTFVRSAEHMQNWTRYLGVARARGALPSLHHPVTRLFPTVSARDVGVIAADVLIQSIEAARHAPVIHVEGPRRYAATDIARALGSALGRDVQAKPLARDAWRAGLTAGGLSHRYAELVVELQDAHNEGRIDAEPGGEVRRGETTIEQALELH